MPRTSSTEAAEDRKRSYTNTTHTRTLENAHTHSESKHQKMVKVEPRTNRNFRGACMR